MSTSQTAPPTAAATPWLWISLSLLAHTGWGTYPVFARYLQTVSHLPAMSILVVGNVVGLGVMLLLFGRRLNWRQLAHPTVAWFCLAVIVRAVTNVLAARYTLSIIVQLITQMTPFVVIVLSVLFFKDRTPRYFGLAVSLCLIGGVLMLSGQLSGGTAVGRQDWLGIWLATTSIFALAMVMLLIRRSAKFALPGEGILIVQMLAIILFSGLVSGVVGEDWGAWTQLGSSDWLVVAGLIGLVFLMSNLGQIFALQHIGAPFVSSMMAWRLVSALIFGWLLLGEQLDAWYQFAGAGIVLLTLTWFLRRQATGAGAES